MRSELIITAILSTILIGCVSSSDFKVLEEEVSWRACNKLKCNEKEWRDSKWLNQDDQNVIIKMINANHDQINRKLEDIESLLCGYEKKCSAPEKGYEGIKEIISNKFIPSSLDLILFSKVNNSIKKLIKTLEEILKSSLQAYDINELKVIRDELAKTQKCINAIHNSIQIALTPNRTNPDPDNGTATECGG